MTEPLKPPQLTMVMGRPYSEKTRFVLSAIRLDAGTVIVRKDRPSFFKLIYNEELNRSHTYDSELDITFLNKGDKVKIISPEQLFRTPLSWDHIHTLYFSDYANWAFSDCNFGNHLRHLLALCNQLNLDIIVEQTTSCLEEDEIVTEALQNLNFRSQNIVLNKNPHVQVLRCSAISVSNYVESKWPLLYLDQQYWGTAHEA